MNEELKDMVYERNLKLQHKCQSIGVNIVCCNRCDAINLHTNTEEDILCCGCFEEIHVNDCTDLFY